MPDLEYSIRELRVEDYDNGFLDCLRELTHVGNITKEMFKQRFEERAGREVITVVAVCNSTGKVLATGSIFYELKFIRECSKKGYIEDVAVAKHAQKRGIGKEIVTHLEKRGIKDGCYKVILTCSEKNIEFYRKMKFKKVEEAMAVYSEDLKASPLL